MNSTFPKKLSEPISVKTLAEKVGNFIQLINSEEKVIQSVASPHEADTNSLVFCNNQNETKLEQMIEVTKSQIIITSKQSEKNTEKCFIVVEDPLAWFIKAANFLFKDDKSNNIPITNVKIDTKSIGKNVKIGVGTFIGNGCHIGDNCEVGMNCYIAPGTHIGAGTFIQNNVNIGSVGLGYHTTKDNERLFFPHLGSVIIGKDCVIGTSCVLVRGELSDTIIGDRVRLGNLVNIGHNVRLGTDTVISSNSCVAGGAYIAERCNLASGVSINAKIKIGADSQVGLGSVVVKDLPSNISVFGNPAKPLRTMRRF